MSASPLNVAFLWHMHQPCYKDPRTGVYRLPWVRLHAVKDYYDMVARLEAFPNLKANFNLVPSLIEQILDYASGKATDPHLELSRKKAEDFTQDDKILLARHAFMGNKKKMIDPYPRYESLLEKCGGVEPEYRARTTIKRCSKRDLVDLQVWSNLVWMDPVFHAEQLVADLFARARNFSEPAKSGLLDRQIEIVGQVLPTYRRMADRGQVELTFSPYFHPILPVLCDSEIAKVSVPGVALPANRIRFPDDAKAQISAGMKLHADILGSVPRGMWPSEGSVSDEALGIAADCGVAWVATDESILEASLGVRLRDGTKAGVARPDLLYKAHRLSYDGGEVAVFFRDRQLSDLISFEYMKMTAEDAVADFVGRLEGIRQDLGGGASESLVLVALDGENCWEFYDRDGDAFLTRLYQELAARDDIRTVCLSEWLEHNRVNPSLKSIYPGSWIDGNFQIWIGSAEDNAAWDMLCEARSHLVAKEASLDEEARTSAWRSVYAAEGSDWYWWYGGEHVCGQNPDYDALFRSHIRHIYERIGVKSPARALQPIMAQQRGPAFAFEPVAIMKPALDGKVTTFYEWRLAGLYLSYKDAPGRAAGVPIITAIYFGFDHECLYLRLDTSVSPQDEAFPRLTFRIEFDTPAERTFEFRAPEPMTPHSNSLMIAEADAALGVRGVALEIVEIAIPLASIPARPGDLACLRVGATKDGQLVERRPLQQVIQIHLPTSDFEDDVWGTL